MNDPTRFVINPKGELVEHECGSLIRYTEHQEIKAEDEKRIDDLDDRKMRLTLSTCELENGQRSYTLSFNMKPIEKLVEIYQCLHPSRVR